jgi:hypothetical protein
MGEAQITAARARRDRINILEKYELRDWAICLDMPAASIREAVMVVGDQVDRVVTYLQERAGTA